MAEISGGVYAGLAGWNNEAAIAGPPSAQALGLAAWKDQIWSGTGRIVGTVKQKASPDNLPVYRRVRLIDLRSGVLVRETWSNRVTGAYAFEGIDATRTWLVLSHDHTRNYNAAVADYLTAEPMP